MKKLMCAVFVCCLMYSMAAFATGVTMKFNSTGAMSKIGGLYFTVPGTVTILKNGEPARDLSGKLIKDIYFRDAKTKNDYSPFSDAISVNPKDIIKITVVSGYDPKITYTTVVKHNSKIEFYSIFGETEYEADTPMVGVIGYGYSPGPDHNKSANL